MSDTPSSPVADLVQAAIEYQAAVDQRRAAIQQYKDALVVWRKGDRSADTDWVVEDAERAKIAAMHAYTAAEAVLMDRALALPIEKP